MAAETSSTSKAKVLDDSNPYPGLRYFVEDESQFFIGRDTEIQELIRRIRRDPLTVLFGISGLGKTSLLLAGVFPALKASGHFPVRLRLEFFGRSGDLASQIIQQTCEKANELGIDSTEPTEGESLWEYFHRAEFWGRRSRLLQPVLVLDQFEEIFSLGTANKDPRVEPFVEELGDLIENRIPKRDRRRIAQSEDLPFSISKQPYRVVLSMREDFLPELEAWHRSIPAVRSNRMRLRPMNGLAALKVVTQVPDRVDDDLAADIVRYVAKDEESPLETLDIEPALLSVVCRELNRRRIAKNLPMITSGLLKVASEELLQNLYEECLNNFPDIRDGLQREIESHLLTKSGMRDNVAVEDFLDEENGITEAVLQDLVEERLVRIEERSGVKRLELSHDRWTDVVAKSRDDRLRREEFEERKRERKEALEAERAEARVREERLVASRKKLRTTFLWSGLAAATIIGVGIYFLIYLDRQSERRQELVDSVTSANEANQAVSKELQTVNREFGAIQVAINELGLLLGTSNNLDEQLSLLRQDRQSEGSGTVREVEGLALEARDDINENYEFLKALSGRFSNDSVAAVAAAVAAAKDAAATQPLAYVEPGDSLPQASLASAGPSIAELIQFHTNDLPEIQQALSTLEGMHLDFESVYAKGLLEYLSMTSFSVWTVAELQRVFELLDNGESDSTQQAVSHANLAAIGLQDMAADGNPGNADGKVLRQKRNTWMQNRLTGSRIQITAALDALMNEKLNPRGRYNALWYLSSSDSEAWSIQNKKDGCEIIRLFESDPGVGASTQEKVAEAKNKINPCN